ncbi:hypothetical protein [Nocardioides luteus]|uniref:hypothetical protein n=1 Tax=Nocardioides luteus TaxID=1844 RepID=UPI0018C9B997|nr:hypothetical protein [Nocardioides luteus]MBG6097149.1 hypothetical protein [Nocardioides luteus]
MVPLPSLPLSPRCDDPSGASHRRLTDTLICSEKLLSRSQVSLQHLRRCVRPVAINVALRLVEPDPPHPLDTSSSFDNTERLA